MLAVLVAATLPWTAAAGEVEQAIRARVAALGATGHPVRPAASRSRPCPSSRTSTAPGRTGRRLGGGRRGAPGAIAASGRHRLRGFHGDRLPALLDAARSSDPAAIAAFELVASPMLPPACLYRGKVDATRRSGGPTAGWNFHRPVADRGPPGTISVWSTS
ncbi:MAG: hypothetical protein R3C69_11390 [Geminicoccaceae bacterium]